MLADDALGATREESSDPLPPDDGGALAAFENDPDNRILVVEHEGDVAGCLHLTFIPFLTYRCRPRAPIEAARVRADLCRRIRILSPP